MERVEPAPDARRLRVILCVPPHEGVAVADLQQQVAGVLPYIRTSVAESIHRRRVPELVLLVQVREEEA